MKKTTIVLTLFVLITGGCGRVKQQQQQIVPQYGGIYTFGSTAEQEARHGELYVYPENDSVMLFYLYVNRGAPSYNSGSIKGRITVSDGKAIFRKRLDYEEKDCLLRFEFDTDTLTVAQDDDDCECGFGYGVYADGTFQRTTLEIPQYYTTITGEKVWFNQWQEKEEQSESGGELNSQKIDSWFISYFPDMVLGEYNGTGKLIPQKAVDRFLPDLIRDGDENVKIYAVGKITNYKGMDLFVCDYEGERPDEDSYDNHTDSIRLLFMYHKNGYPCLDNTDDENTGRVIYTMASHYYGEGGESEYKSYFDTDTTIIARHYFSEIESATGYNTPLITNQEFRWVITQYGEKEILETTKREFSSPFYDRNWLREQDWGDVKDEGFNRAYPTRDDQWPLFRQEDNEISLYFFISRNDAGELVPVFHVRDESLIELYSVGEREEVEKAAEAGRNIERPGLFNIVIKTSDGDLGMLPNGEIILFDEVQEE